MGEDIYEVNDSWVFEGGDDVSQVSSDCVEKYMLVRIHCQWVKEAKRKKG